MTAVLEALGVNLALGGAALLLRAVRPSGLLGGVALGTLIYLGAGRPGFAILVAFFLLGSLLTRVGYAAKADRGVAEERGGRRGLANAVANGLTGLLLAGGMALAAARGWEDGIGLIRVAYAAAFATAAADTASSEIGSLWGRHPISLRTFRAVPAGTEGAVSVEGTLAGVGAALVLALVGSLLGWYGATGVVVVTVAAALGNLAESVAASWGMKSRGHHQLLNFLNTVAGAVLAALLGRLMGLGS